MKLEDLKKIRDIIDKEIEKMERNAEAQRRFVAKKGKSKSQTLAERVQKLEKQLSK